MTHNVIYVPGLSDQAAHIAHGQQSALRTWHRLGVKTIYFDAKWMDKSESYTQKRARLVALIDMTYKNGHTVSLVSASAGSSLALNALVVCKDRIHAFVSICGMIKHVDGVGAPVFALNPAFKDAMINAMANESKLTAQDRRKILIIRAWHDGYVPRRHGYIKDAHTSTIPSAGHVFSIVMAITLFKRRIIRFIKHT